MFLSKLLIKVTSFYFILPVILIQLLFAVASPFVVTDFKITAGTSYNLFQENVLWFQSQRILVINSDGDTDKWSLGTVVLASLYYVTLLCYEIQDVCTNIFFMITSLTFFSIGHDFHYLVLHDLVTVKERIVYYRLVYKLTVLYNKIYGKALLLFYICYLNYASLLIVPRYNSMEVNAGYITYTAVNVTVFVILALLGAIFANQVVSIYEIWI